MKLKNELKAKNEEENEEFSRKACYLGSVNGGQAEACHRYAAMFIKVATLSCIRILYSNPHSLWRFNFLSHYLFQGTKGACEKNMEEAFKYSLKVQCSSKIAQVYSSLFCNANCKTSSLGLWIGKHGWLCKCKYLPPIHIYHLSHDRKLGTSITWI